MCASDFSKEDYQDVLVRPNAVILEFFTCPKKIFLALDDQLKDLKKAKIPHEVIGYSEIDKFASQLFDANFPNIKK